MAESDFDVPEHPRFLRGGFRLPLWRDTEWARYAGAVAVVGLAVLVRYQMLGDFPTGYAFVTFYPAVIVTAFLFGPGPAVLSTVLGLALSWALFITPGATFFIGNQPRAASVIYLVLSALVIAVTHSLQTVNRRLEEERERNRRLAENRAVMFGELQHRVGNNLQMVASVLMLQRRGLESPEALAAIDDAARRVGLIGKVQRRLYEPDGAQLDLRSFLHELCRDLAAASGAAGVTCRVEAAPGLDLPPRLAIPTALLVAEGVNNAIEHGYTASGEGEIRVVAAVTPANRLAITVSNDGAGLPEGFDVQDDSGLGLRIARKLAEYQGGTLELASAGAVTEFRFELALEG